MKILVTGAKGFIGKNLVWNLKNVKDGKDRTRDLTIDEIFEYDVNDELETLKEYTKKCDFVFNLAGINRPQNTEEFNINHSFLGQLLGLLKESNNKCPVMLSSSTQAKLDNEYGKSKKEAEDLIKDLKDALEKKDIEEIKTKKDKLQEKAMALATKVYENIQKEQAASQENTNTESSNDKKDDNVADASYEEK